MPPLHTVNASPFASHALESCIAHMTEGAALLLLEDGVYAALADGAAAKRLVMLLRSHAVYVLAPDLATRGLADASLVDGVQTVDYGGFVDLAAEHSSVIAWI